MRSRLTAAGYYTYPCNTNVSIGFTFGGITYNLTSDDFNLGTFVDATATEPALCLGAFFDLVLSAGSQAVISWVIGDAFLKNVYSCVALSRLRMKLISRQGVSLSAYAGRRLCSAEPFLPLHLAERTPRRRFGVALGLHLPRRRRLQQRSRWRSDHH